MINSTFSSGSSCREYGVSGIGGRRGEGILPRGKNCGITLESSSSTFAWSCFCKALFGFVILEFCAGFCEGTCENGL